MRPIDCQSSVLLKTDPDLVLVNIRWQTTNKNFTRVHLAGGHLGKEPLDQRRARASRRFSGKILLLGNHYYKNNEWSARPMTVYVCTNRASNLAIQNPSVIDQTHSC